MARNEIVQEGLSLSLTLSPHLSHIEDPKYGEGALNIITAQMQGGIGWGVGRQE